MKWKMLSSENVIRNEWITLRRAAFELPSGKVLRDYWLVEKRDFVVIVAQCDGDVILVREYRPATDRFYLSAPAGYIDDGETPLEAAARECLEETGYEVVSAELLSESHFSPGWLKESAFFRGGNGEGGCRRGEDRRRNFGSGTCTVAGGITQDRKW